MNTLFVLTHYYDSNPKYGYLVQTNLNFKAAEQLVLYILCEYYTVEFKNGGWGYHFSSKDMVRTLKRYFAFKVMSTKYSLNQRKDYTIIDMYDLWEENSCKSDYIISTYKKRFGSDELWSSLNYFYATKFWMESFNYSKRLWMKKARKTKEVQFILLCYKAAVYIPNLIQQMRFEKECAEYERYCDNYIDEYYKKESNSKKVAGGSNKLPAD